MSICCFHSSPSAFSLLSFSVHVFFLSSPLPSFPNLSSSYPFPLCFFSTFLSSFPVLSFPPLFSFPYLSSTLIFSPPLLSSPFLPSPPVLSSLLPSSSPLLFSPLLLSFPPLLSSPFLSLSLLLSFPPLLPFSNFFSFPFPPSFLSSPFLQSSPLLSYPPFLSSPPFPFYSFPFLPLLPSSPFSPFLFSPPLLPASPLHPSHQSLKETKAPSLSWSWEELSVPSVSFDDSISNDTLILTPHCLFFLYDEIQLERRATGHIIKMWLKHEEPHSSLETTPDNFLTHQCKEHDRVGGEGIVGTEIICSPCR